MNGAAHYAEAERAAKLAETMDLDTGEFYLALAQVHATLALAAATALPPANYPGSARLREWIDTVEPAPVGVTS